LPPNLVNEIVAEDHVTERPLSAYGFIGQFLNNFADLANQPVVLWITGTVDEQAPIEIAPIRIFIASERSRDDDAVVLGIEI